MSLETLRMVLYLIFPIIIAVIVALAGLIFLFRWSIKKQLNLLLISIFCLVSVALFIWWAYNN